eukprot:GHVL01040483.1.p1 GENE.GHVL01040483.1~~GHVL01040483.1.p1  ORF type:complete len:346 (+),score=99.05 GHVL01040483.1:41-1078(+)
MAPPKKGDAKSQKGKGSEAAKTKLVEDKTFGLKNKNKSKTVQKMIKQMTSAVKGGQRSIDAEMDARKQKAKIDKEAALLSSLFEGTDNIKKIDAAAAKVKQTPQSIKEGQKIDLYVDQREQKEETMENWSMEHLRSVIDSKHGSTSHNVPTDIVCKFFLEAVEKKVYGWFWQCPNGDKCKYRHHLPPGYVLKKEVVEEDEEEIPIEELIEQKRAALPSGGTPVTEETLNAWFKKKEEGRKALVEEERQKAIKQTGGRGLHVLTGKDLFTFDPSLFVDDDDAVDAELYEEDSNCETDAANAETDDATNNETPGGDAPPVEEEEKTGKSDVSDDALFNDDAELPDED